MNSAVGKRILHFLDTLPDTLRADTIAAVVAMFDLAALAPPSLPREWLFNWLNGSDDPRQSYLHAVLTCAALDHALERRGNIPELIPSTPDLRRMSEQARPLALHRAAAAARWKELRNTTLEPGRVRQEEWSLTKAS
jgi:hypothetical protein